MLRFRFSLAVCSIMAVTSLGHLAIGAPPELIIDDDLRLPEADVELNAVALPELLPVEAAEPEATSDDDTDDTDDDAATEPVANAEQEPQKPDAPAVRPSGPRDLKVELTSAFAPIGSVGLSVKLNTDKELPPNAAAGYFNGKGPQSITGASTGALPCWYQYNHAFYHQPLYFEDPNLERCGWDACCLQPAISGAKFYAAVGLLPLKMLKSPPCCPVWALEDCLSCESYDDLDVLLNR